MHDACTLIIGNTVGEGLTLNMGENSKLGGGSIVGFISISPLSGSSILDDTTVANGKSDETITYKDKTYNRTYGAVYDNTVYGTVYGSDTFPVEGVCIATSANEINNILTMFQWITNEEEYNAYMSNVYSTPEYSANIHSNLIRTIGGVGIPARISMNYSNYTYDIDADYNGDTNAYVIIQKNGNTANKAMYSVKNNIFGYYTYLFASFSGDSRVIIVAPDYKKPYTATFVDENGNTVATEIFTEDDMNINEPAVPEKDGYTGAWERYELTLSDITIHPIYTHLKHTVTFYDEDGTIISSGEYANGETLLPPPAPEKPGDNVYEYIFTGWDTPPVSVVDSCHEYTAIYEQRYKEYSIRFMSDDGKTVISEKVYHYGDAVAEPAAPTKADDDKYTYSFIGWDKEVISIVDGSYEYVAVYTATRKSFIIQTDFINVQPDTPINGAAVIPGDDIIFTIIPDDENIYLPPEIKVTIDDKVLDSSEYEYSPDTGKVTIPNDKVTGDVFIAAQGKTEEEITEDDKNDNGAVAIVFKKMEGCGYYLVNGKAIYNNTHLEFPRGSRVVIKVVLLPGYQKSNYTVWVNGTPMYPDANGEVVISSLDTYTLIVVPDIVKDKTQDTIKNTVSLIDKILQLIERIASFFRNLFN